MMRERKPVGQMLTAMRKKRRITLEELSDKTGISASHLKDIEEGKGFASVGDILRIARALTIDPGELLQSGREREKELLQKRIQDFNKRQEAYQYEVLTPQAKKDHLRAFKVFIPARSEHPGVNYRHEGEEFVYALKGEVEIQVGHKKYRIAKDETLHFNSGIRHALRNPGNKTTVLIVTIYTP
ncbi:MAG: hypothetical protein A2176_12095 [Spirochaetes bacterium RBG_13_51_14]|nr:MAG: hypothetical protein A2176_12095 [Spirochaetes bacterium RBG_13_51_14]